MRTARILPFLLPLVLACVLRSHGAAEKAASPVDAIASGDAAAGRDAVEEIRVARSKAIRKLVALIEERNHKPADPVVANALNALGEMRAIEVTDVLIDHLRYPGVIRRWDGVRMELIGVDEEFSAIGALVNFDTAAAEPLMEATAGGRFTDFEKRGVAYILARVYGPHGAAVRVRLYAETLSPRQKEHLVCPAIMSFLERDKDVPADKTGSPK